MKFYHLATLICCVATAGLGLAQDCVRSISTNPEEPSNSEWPMLFPGTPESFKNTGFDWRPIPPVAPIIIDKTQNWVTPYAGQSGVINMKNPFTISNGPSTAYLWNNKALAEMDWYWEDGWELLYMNLGFLPNGDPVDNKSPSSWIGPEDPTPDNAPYFILYNRYRGTMRLFANVWFTDVGQYDFVNVRFEFVQNGEEETFSGIFRHVEGLDRALDQPTLTTSLISPRSHPGSSGSVNTSQWMAADFQLGFDPCQCRIPSKLYLTFETTDAWEMDLEVRTIALERDLNKLNYDERNFLQWEAGNPGNTIYRSIEDLLKQYEEALAKYNSDLDDYNAPLNQLKINLINQAVSPLADGIANMVVPIGGVRDYLLRNKLKLWDEDLIIPQDTNQAQQWAVSVKTSVKNGLAEEFDFLSTVLDIQQKPVAPQVPTGTFTEGRIQGSLTNTAFFRSEPLFVPGTVPTAPGSDKYQITSQNFPAYNNTPGLFAMLTTPRLDVYANEETPESCQLEELEACEYGFNNYLMSSKNTYRFKLKDVNYTINPALDFDMEKTRFSGALKITIKGYNGIGTDERFIERFLENSNFEQIHKVNENGFWVTEFISEYYNLEDIHNVFFNLERTSRTEYSYGCPAQIVQDAIVLTNPRFQEFRNNWCLYKSEYIDKIELKVVADMYFDQIGSHGEQVNTFQVFTYNLFNAEEHESASIFALRNSGLVNIEEPGMLYTYKPGDIELAGEIGVNHPSVYEIIGNELVIKGERITIQNGVTPQSGYTLRIIGKEYVHVDPASQFNPSVTVELNPFQTGPINYPVTLTSAYLNDYCGSTYKANTLTASKRNSLAALESQEIIREKLDLTIYPNPVGDWFRFKNGIGQISYTVKNSQGVTVMQGNIGSNEQVNTAQLTPGLYIVLVGEQALKFIKN